MPTRTPLRAEFYGFMFDDCPGAVSYWAETEWIDDDHLVLHELGDEPEAVATYALTVESIATGWRRLLELEKEGKWWHCGVAENPIAATERALCTGDGGEEYDACVLDAVVQLAIFSEVVYS